MGASEVDKKNESEKITFVQWIDRMGMNTLAKKLGVDRVTIRNWRTGRGDPRVDHMRRIKRISGGEIGYDQIIDRFVFTSRVRRNPSEV